jgi:hypothetical protein
MVFPPRRCRLATDLPQRALLNRSRGSPMHFHSTDLWLLRMRYFPFNVAKEGGTYRIAIHSTKRRQFELLGFNYSKPPLPKQFELVLESRLRVITKTETVLPEVNSEGLDSQNKKTPAKLVFICACCGNERKLSFPQYVTIPRYLATINVIEMGGALPPELKARITGELGIEGEPESIDVLTERFRKRLGRVTLSRDLTRADPAIAKLLNRDEAIRQKMASSSFYWGKPLFESSYERRRLRILNSIFLAFAKVGGGSAYIRDREAREISISGPAGVSITLDSPKKRQARNRRSDDADTKDKLELRAEVGRHHPDTISNWIDDDAGKLEDKLTEIVIGLAIVSERESRRWQAEMAEWQRKREDEEAEARRKAKEKAEREERERIAAEEKARCDGLLTEAKNWRSARLIREFVGARRASEAAQVPELENWASWALKEADRMDPLFNVKSSPDIEGV